MSTLPKLYTVADLETFPDDGNRYEIIGGELIVSAAPLERHQLMQGELFRLLVNHVHGRRIGRVYVAPVDLRFSEQDQVQPDIIVLLNERRSLYRGNTVVGAPDLVVEVLSPSSVERDRHAKLALYERNGVPEYWIADPATATVRQYVPREGAFEQIPPVEGLLRSVAIPEFTLDMAAFAAELAW